MFIERMITAIFLWLIAFLMIFFHKHPSPTSLKLGKNWYIEKSRLVVKIIGMIFLTILLFLFTFYGLAFFKLQK